MGGPSAGEVPSSYSGSAAAARRVMVQAQIAARGVTDLRVLQAMASVPRQRFLPPRQPPLDPLELLALAHADQPQPIGHGQTISQPYIVALMAESLALGPADRVLEVGAGSGYLAAVLSHLTRSVFAVELEPELHARARATLDQLGYGQVQLSCGDGALGWPEQAPFDAIVFSCAATRIPGPAWAQLKLGGRLLLPLGPPGGLQELTLIVKTPAGGQVRHLLPVAFVPLRP